MDPRDIEVALRSAFAECAAAGIPLDEQQKQLLLQAIDSLNLSPLVMAPDSMAIPSINPLADLAPQERQALLDFIRDCHLANRDWKSCLLNDWLEGRSSGAVQFIRDRYGPQWVKQIQPVHLATYTAPAWVEVKVGDRLEVSNSLWEWVPDPQTSEREWYPCTVVRLFESLDAERQSRNCTVRLENGLEYDIYGMYDWNRHHWRLPQT